MTQPLEQQQCWKRCCKPGRFPICSGSPPTSGACSIPPQLEPWKGSVLVPYQDAYVKHEVPTRRNISKLFLRDNYTNKYEALIVQTDRAQNPFIYQNIPVMTGNTTVLPGHLALKCVPSALGHWPTGVDRCKSDRTVGRIPSHLHKFLKICLEKMWVEEKNNMFMESQGSIYSGGYIEACYEWKLPWPSNGLQEKTGSEKRQS